MRAFPAAEGLLSLPRCPGASLAESFLRLHANDVGALASPWCGVTVATAAAAEGETCPRLRINDFGALASPWCGAAVATATVVLAVQLRRRRGRRRPASVAAGAMCRRDAAGAAATAAAGCWFGVAMAPKPASAGPFVNFLSEVLPVKEAQRAFAQFDYFLRDSSTDVLDRARQVPEQPDAVDDAPGAEPRVLAAANAAATVAGADLVFVEQRAAELEAEEPRRLRQRTELGREFFESEMLGKAMVHLVARMDSWTFRAFCRWRAYADALAAAPPGAARVFQLELGRRLLRDLGAPLRPRRARPAAAFITALEGVAQAAVKAGLVARARVEVDEVLADDWSTGGSLTRDLPLTVVMEGDPLVDAQIILYEERALSVLPDPVFALLDVWLGDSQALAAGSEAVVESAALDQYLVNQRFERRFEKRALAYVPQQRFFQITLRDTREAASAAG
mmetsp:Transcript_46104/g.128188  ORF Transcript_46104/g.128188 Transcript_46104/m.128188 type:complete len:450 (-) Transcript_46104:52-1401(-)|eukprot:CAMPEP_0117528796 /NCGR_PEP_ID=MMETSP0784-20121206/37501_1 /TAXON_ID=39447 /ORGANISM="" /LENGTH=449 /DNA_ID=CAMNT_0005325097 /DNA_START=52 /DNA_END=1401 /DNA_ORIENTATION=-